MTEYNQTIGPILRRKGFWAAAVGANITASDLAWNGFYPREVRVGKGGDLAVTYADSTSEVIKSIPDGAVFVDCCWASVAATNSTAYALSFGW